MAQWGEAVARRPLTVPMRSYRSERVSQWVDAVLEGRLASDNYQPHPTRAREGMVLFVPQGAPLNGTRKPGTYEAVAGYLGECGVG